MKTKRIFLLIILSLFLFSLAACAGEQGVAGPTGPQGSVGPQGSTGIQGPAGPVGPAGLPGQDGQDGTDGIDGTDGVDGTNGTNGTNGTDGINGTNGINGVGISSAALNEAGELVITLTDATELNLGLVVGLDGIDGQDVAMQITAAGMLQWKLGDGEWMDLVAPVTDVTETLSGVYDFIALVADEGTLKYRFMTEAGIWQLDLDVILYDAAGDAYMFGATDVKTALTGAIAFTDVVIVNGLVTEFRLADTDTSLKLAKQATTNPLIVKTGTTAVVFTIRYSFLIEEFLSNLTPAAGASMALKEGTTVKTAGLMLPTKTYTVITTAEDGMATFTYSVAFVPGYNVVNLEVGKLTSGALTISSGAPVAETLSKTSIISIDDSPSNRVITVVGDADASEVLARLYNVSGSAYYNYATATIVMTNSEEVTKVGTVMYNGDKVIVTTIDGTEVTYTIALQDSTRVLKTNTVVKTVSSTEILVPWGTSVTDFLAALETTDGTDLDYTLNVREGSAWVEYSEADEPATAIKTLTTVLAFQVIIDTQSSTYTYLVNAQPSTSVAFEVKEGSEYLVTAVDHTAKTVNVQYQSTVANLVAALAITDGSTGSFAVKTPADVTKSSGVLFVGDKLYITAAAGGTPVVYRVFINAVLTNPALELVAEPEYVVFAGAGIAITPEKVSTATSYAAITYGELFADLALAKYGQSYFIYTDTNWAAIESTFDPAVLATQGTKTSVSSGTAVPSTHVLVVMSQDGKSYTAYPIDYQAKLGITDLTLIDSEDREWIIGLVGTEIQVNYRPEGKSTIVTDALILAEIDLNLYFQTRLFGGTAISAGTPDARTLTIFAQDHVTTTAENKTVYTIKTVKSTDVVLKLSETVANHVDTMETGTIKSIRYNAQRAIGVNWDASSFSTYYNTGFDIDTNYQTQALVVFNPATSLYVPFATAVGSTSPLTATEKAAAIALTSSDIYVRVTAQDGTTFGYYNVSFAAKSDNVTLNVIADTNPLFDVQGDIVYVASGTTGTALSNNLDRATFWQTIVVQNNAGTAITSALLVDYDQVKVTAQNGTIKVYTIMVVNPNLTPTKVSTAANQSSVAIDNTLKTITIGNYGTTTAPKYVTAAELLAMLQTSGSRSYALFTSEGLAKTQTALFDGDYLVVTTVGIDGVSYTSTYIIIA